MKDFQKLIISENYIKKLERQLKIGFRKTFFDLIERNKELKNTIEDLKSILTKRQTRVNNRLEILAKQILNLKDKVCKLQNLSDKRLNERQKLQKDYDKLLTNHIKLQQNYNKLQQDYINHTKLQQHEK